MQESSLTGLFGTREQKATAISKMTNEELFSSYTHSCRSGEIEVNLAEEKDFDQFALRKELRRRLIEAGFLQAGKDPWEDLPLNKDLRR